MDAIMGAVEKLNGLVWGVPMLVLILGTGLYLTVGLKFMPVLKLGFGIKQLWIGRKSTEEGDITPFNALMTAMAATVGVGNIAGVAVAIAKGGPGALFWMWCTALVGMATKYAEAVCAVKYREVDELGNHVGGPMYYIKNGLGDKWLWLAMAFAIFGGLAGFGIGNAFQANQVAAAMKSTFDVNPWVSGFVMAIFVGLVLIGGIQRLGKVAGKLVPFMAVVYVLGGLIILLLNVTEIPAALMLIIKSAFTPVAAVGGFAGAAVAYAIQMGVARGIFSNEAGLGSAPIAHAAAQSKDPVRQGTIAMLGTFIDTIIICTITGLVIVITGAWMGDEKGAALSAAAFNAGFSGGQYIVTFGIAIFALTTLLGWSYYGEKCVEYIFGVKSIMVFRFLWVIAIPVGATYELKNVVLVADTLNALMALPNLIALLLLSPIVFKLTRDYFNKE